jgi:hypothetical protein
MNKLFNIFIYTLVYYELDNILKPLIYDRYHSIQIEPILFNPIIQTANIFILCVFIFLTSELMFVSKTKNYTLYSLSLIYIKYVYNNLVYSNNINLYYHELRIIQYTQWSNKR